MLRQGLPSLTYIGDGDMKIPDFGFVGPAYTARSRSIDLQECINMYIEMQANGSKSTKTLIPTPGLKRHCTLPGTGSCRGIYSSSNGNVYTVAGPSLYKINLDGTYAKIGDIGTSSGRVGIADNGSVAKEMIIVDGTYGYIYDWDAGTVDRITSESFPENPTHVVFRNGRFIVNRGGSGQFYWSAAYDGTTWGGDFSTAEGSPDDILAIHSINNEVILFGKSTTEFWCDNADANEPFIRIPSGFINIGCGAIGSVASINNDVFWLGSTPGGGGVIWHTSSYSPNRISNHAIENDLRQMPDLTEAYSYCYEQTGHYFYVLTLPSLNKTYCYDMTTDAWHTRAGYDAYSGNFTFHRALYAAQAWNKVFAGDISSSAIWELDQGYYLDDGAPIHRVRTAPHIHNSNERVFYNSFELDITKGVGPSTGQGYNPIVSLQWSNDGGYQWGALQQRSIGKMGEYTTRVRWNGLGSSRDRVFRLVISDPIEFAILSATIDISG